MSQKTLYDMLAEMNMIPCNTNIESFRSLITEAYKLGVQYNSTTYLYATQVLVHVLNSGIKLAKHFVGIKLNYTHLCHTYNRSFLDERDILDELLYNPTLDKYVANKAVLTKIRETLTARDTIFTYIADISVELNNPIMFTYTSDLCFIPLVFSYLNIKIDMSAFEYWFKNQTRHHYISFETWLENYIYLTSIGMDTIQLMCMPKKYVNIFINDNLNYNIHELYVTQMNAILTTMNLATSQLTKDTPIQLLEKYFDITYRDAYNLVETLKMKDAKKRFIQFMNYLLRLTLNRNISSEQRKTLEKMQSVNAKSNQANELLKFMSYLVTLSYNEDAMSKLAYLVSINKTPEDLYTIFLQYAYQSPINNKFEEALMVVIVVQRYVNSVFYN